MNDKTDVQSGEVSSSALVPGIRCGDGLFVRPHKRSGSVSFTWCKISTESLMLDTRVVRAYHSCPPARLSCFGVS